MYGDFRLAYTNSFDQDVLVAGGFAEKIASRVCSATPPRSIRAKEKDG